eukprot:scaffold176247_cov22-Tisochrysis_lutea.AAC.1
MLALCAPASQEGILRCFSCSHNYTRAEGVFIPPEIHAIPCCEVRLPPGQDAEAKAAADSTAEALVSATFPPTGQAVQCGQMRWVIRTQPSYMVWQMALAHDVPSALVVP